MKSTKNIFKIIFCSMILTFFIPQNILASESVNMEQTVKKTINSFEMIDNPIDCIFAERDSLSLEEITDMMPDTLKVYCDDEILAIPVEWESVGEEFENSESYYFQFSPVWNEDQYSLDTSITEDEIPYISVFLNDKSSSKTRASVSGNTNEAIIYNFLINEMDLNMAGACGVLANIKHESSFNPTALGDRGTSYGICQWHSARWEAMKQWCKDNGYNWENLTGQLNYLKYELSKNDYRYLWNGKTIYEKLLSVKNTKTGAYNAGYYWCKLFEVPADTENSSKTRGNLAKNTYWKAYDESTAKTPGKPTLTVTAKDSVVETKFSWKAVKNAKSYNLRVLKLSDGDYKYFDDIWTITDTSYSLILPEGKYSVKVEACNEEKFTASSTKKFEVKEGIKLKYTKGDSYTKTKLSWNKLSRASYYNIQIMKKEEGEYVPYKKRSELTGSSYSILLPEGSYSAYITAYNDKKESCSESKTIKFTLVKCKHNETEIKNIIKATTSKKGFSGDEYCLTCEDMVSEGKTLYSPKTISLSTTTYTYNSEKTRKPTVTVKDSKGNKISSSYYTVKYPSGRKNVGKYTVKVTFKDNYSGTLTKSFTIVPKKTKLSSIAAATKAITVKWEKKTTQVDGYQLQYSTNKKFTDAKKKTISTDKTTSKKISGLKAKKRYYVQIRTYKLVGGKKYYSDWSSYKSIKTK